MKIQRDTNAYNGESYSFFALPLFLACATVFKGIIILTNIHFSLNCLEAESSLRLPWSLPALFSLPSYLRDGPKLSHCHFWLTGTCLHSLSRWLRGKAPPLLLPSSSRVRQSRPLLCLDQVKKN